MDGSSSTQLEALSNAEWDLYFTFIFNIKQFKYYYSVTINLSDDNEECIEEKERM